jgi:hypothetical protein
MSTQITIDVYPDEIETISHVLKGLDDGAPLDPWGELAKLEALLIRIATALEKAKDRESMALAAHIEAGELYDREAQTDEES